MMLTVSKMKVKSTGLKIMNVPSPNYQSNQKHYEMTNRMLEYIKCVN